MNARNVPKVGVEKVKMAGGTICARHRPRSKSLGGTLGYLAHFEWAEKQISAGKQQIECLDCHRWYFPEEMG